MTFGVSINYIAVRTSVGDRYLQYYCSPGTNHQDGSGNVNFFLGSGYADDEWQYFERNVQEDWDSVAASGVWQKTDGFLIRPDATLAHDFYIDDLRLSNAMTAKTYTLGAGAVGGLVSSREPGAGGLGWSDSYFHYDHIGNVTHLTDSAGAIAEEYWQDAFGNVINNTTGEWVGLTHADQKGYHLTTKEYDGNVGMYFFNYRWHDPSAGRFVSKPPYSYIIEHQYSYVQNNPILYTDPAGKLVSVDEKSCGVHAEWMYEVIRRAYLKIASLQITPSYLKTCIFNQMRSPSDKYDVTLYCNKCKNRPANGEAPIGKPCNPKNKVRICIDQFLDNQNNGYQFPSTDWLADTLIHELAHTCGWNHLYVVEGFPVEGVPHTPGATY